MTARSVFGSVLSGVARQALGEGVGWRAPATNVALFGDSISAQNTDAGRYNANGYLVATNALMGWPMDIVANGGVSGNTTTQMLARLSDFLSDNPTVGMVTILGGTNDPGEGISAATTIANLDAIYAMCRLMGVRPVAMTILPRNDQVSAGIADFIDTVNTAIRASSGPFAVIDSHAALADLGNSGLPYANSLVDDVHPAIAGAYRIARDAAVDVLSPVVGTNGAGTSDDDDYLEYASNPIGEGDNADTVNGWRLGTGITGTGPDGWSGRRRNTGSGVASKSGSAALMAGTFGANWDGVGFLGGGDDILALGRYDQGWGASQAYPRGTRKRPTTPNGYHYRVLVGGTSGGSEPTWPTTEGDTITDGTVTWLCQRTPVEGDTFVATLDLQISGLTSGKWVVPKVQLDALNTSNASIGQGIGNRVDLSSTTDFGLEDFAPSFMRLVTPEMTLGAGSLRYLILRADLYGQTSSSATISVLRQSIRRTSA